MTCVASADPPAFPDTSNFDGVGQNESNFGSTVQLSYKVIPYNVIILLFSYDQTETLSKMFKNIYCAKIPDNSGEMTGYFC